MNIHKSIEQNTMPILNQMNDVKMGWWGMVGAGIQENLMGCPYEIMISLFLSQICPN